MVKKFQALVKQPLILLVFCYAFFVFSLQPGEATGPLCCWSPQNAPLTGNVEGTIVDVKKAEQTLIIRVNDKDVDFKFEAAGSDEQKKLLDTLKPGDIVAGQAMDAKVEHVERESVSRMNQVLMTSEPSEAKKGRFYHFKKKQ